MAMMTPALLNVTTPEDAVAKAFRGQGTIVPAHLLVREIPAEDLGDRAWPWTFTPNAPVIRDVTAHQTPPYERR